MSSGHLIGTLAASSLFALGLIVVSASIAVSKVLEARRERRLSEESRTRFADVMELAADWIWETDADHRFIYLSDRLGEVTGYDPKQALGLRRTDMALQDAVESEAWEMHLEDLNARRPFREFRYSLTDANGRRRTISISGKPIFGRDGAFLGYRGTGTDLTETMEARRQATSAEERARLVLDSAHDAFVSVDVDGRVIDWNPAAQQIFGWTREDVLGRPLTELIVPDQLQDRHAELMAKLRAGQVGTIRRRARTLAKRNDGTVFPCELSMTETESPDGRQFNAFMRDITLQEQHESALERARKYAEAANRAKSDFLAAMSHELRTPLNAIIGFSDVLLSNTDLAAEKQQEYLQDISQSGTHLLDLINDVLDVSKVEAGRLDLHEDSIDLAATCESCLRLLNERAQEHDIRLQLDVEESLPPLYADAKRLKQILLNLLSNAVKFTPVGGLVRLVARLGDDGGVELLVQDNGIGMPPSQVEHALKPFSQLDSGYARRQEGTGLGLALAKILTELHGGELKIETAVGEGTSVTVYFPQARVLEYEERTAATLQPASSAI